jgi:hypothetical protein
LDPDLDQLEIWAHNKKIYVNIQIQHINLNTKNLNIVKIKISLILDPLDLKVDQFKQDQKTRNLNTQLDLAYQRTPIIQFSIKSNKV